VQATRSEVLFVDYMAEHLTATGRAAIVVPEGIIFQSGTAYKALRKMLVDTSLVAVVSLPAGVFNPYSGVKTSILFLDKRVYKQTDSVLFVKVGNDGFNLGAQRRAVANSDLPGAARLLRSWITGPQACMCYGEMARAVERSRIGEGGNFNLSGERYEASIVDASSPHALVPIGDLCEPVGEIEENLHGGVGLVHITKGNLERICVPVPSREVQQQIVDEIDGYQKVIDGARLVLSGYRPQVTTEASWSVLPLIDLLQGKPKNGYSGQPVDYATNTRVLSLSATTSGVLDLSKFKFLDEEIAPDAACRCRRNDIYLQRGNTKELVGTAAIFDTDAQGYIFPDLMIRVRADESKICSKFLLHVLQGKAVREFLIGHAVGAAGSMPKINQRIVESIPIPLPDLPTQRAIVAEIETEQALVNANRELVRRMEAKIKVAIDRVWGSEAPLPEVAHAFVARVAAAETLQTETAATTP
jgi:hypothetical protein